MREIAVIISDLYLPRDAQPPSTAAIALPGLEEAARFGQKGGVNGGWRAWLARSLGRDDLAGGAPAAIAAAAIGLPRLATGSVWIANPIHLITGLTSLHLDYRGLLRLPPPDLAQLAQDFTAAFGEAEFRLEALDCGPFLLHSARTVNAVTTEPSRVLAQDLEASLPTGPDAATLKRLGAELEMWLHSHPVNESRARRGELPISTLWPWGGGAGLDSQNGPPMHGAADTPAAASITFGSDPYLVGLSRLSGLTLHSLPQRLPDPTDWPPTQRVVLVTDLTASLQANPAWTMFEALAHLDRNFIFPAIEALRAGSVDSVLVMANDVRLHVSRRDRLRFWRPRPKSGGAAILSLT